mmetsp:Transcript_24597/g.70994  ORF Transcript_24597/g.70994 Transcript_24597/m.70994 type:complete len:217 (-) Transcript_24597:111-761(-)
MKLLPTSVHVCVQSSCSMAERTAPLPRTCTVKLRRPRTPPPTMDDMPSRIRSAAEEGSRSSGTDNTMLMSPIDGKLSDRQPSNGSSVRLTALNGLTETLPTSLSSPSPSNTPRLSSPLTGGSNHTTPTPLGIFWANSRPAAPPTALTISSDRAPGKGCRWLMMAGRGEGVPGGGTELKALQTRTAVTLSNESVLAISMAVSMGLSTGWVRSCWLRL